MVLLPYIGRSLLSPTLLSTCALAAIFDNKCRFPTQDGGRIAKSSAKSTGKFEWFELTDYIVTIIRVPSFQEKVFIAYIILAFSVANK
jgi:hypothetical protein